MALIKGFPFDPTTKPDGALGPVVEGHWAQTQIFEKTGSMPYLKVYKGTLYWYYLDVNTGEELVVKAPKGGPLEFTYEFGDRQVPREVWAAEPPPVEMNMYNINIASSTLGQTVNSDASAPSAPPANEETVLKEAILTMGKSLENMAPMGAYMKQLTGHVGLMLSNQVARYDGENPQHCRDWIRAVEKLAQTTGGSPVKIALNSASGVLCTFMTDWDKTHPNDDGCWDLCKKEIKGRFGAVVDQTHAQRLLYHYEQGRQNIQVYATRLALMS